MNRIIAGASVCPWCSALMRFRHSTRTRIRTAPTSCAITGREGDDALATGCWQPFHGIAICPAAEPLVDPTRQKRTVGRPVRPRFPRVDRRHPSWALLHRILVALPVNELAGVPSSTFGPTDTIVCVLPILTQNSSQRDRQKFLPAATALGGRGSCRAATQKARREPRPPIRKEPRPPVLREPLPATIADGQLPPTWRDSLDPNRQGPRDGRRVPLTHRLQRGGPLTQLDCLDFHVACFPLYAGHLAAVLPDGDGAGPPLRTETRSLAAEATLSCGVTENSTLAP